MRQQDILHLGHLKRTFALLDRLHTCGCVRDKAGNRTLFFDDYCKLVLLYIWNPLIVSIRDLQEAASLPKVAKALGIKRVSAGSFSESVRVFEPEQLKPIIAELAGELTPCPPPRDPRLGELKELKHVLTLVDGTVLTALTRLARSAVGAAARYNTSRDGRAVYGWRLHTQFDLDTFSPHRIDRTGARNAGANRENNMLRANLEPGRCYVGDGGYADASLFDDIIDIGSSFAVRCRADATIERVIEERLLSQAALDAGVVRDVIIEAPGAKHRLRRVEVQVAPHPRRVRSGTKQTDLIVLCTNLLELPAELVALIYQQRYTLELFFRIFKQLLGMRHLLSQREEGIDVQVYCAVIVCLLIQLTCGKRPNKAMRNMIVWYLLGLADEQDVINFLNRPDNTGVKLRAKDELWKKLGY